MLLDLIYGGVGSGKTEKCIELIERTLKKNPGHNAILTVPDQYSYTAEKRLAQRLGGTGVNGIEVVTFTQFFKRYIKKDDAYLTPSGKQMLFYTAALQKSEGTVFSNSADKPGFVSKISELAGEMKRYLITPDILREYIPDDGSMLSKKANAFADIFEEYDRILQKGFLDSDDDFLRFAQFIEESGEFKNTHIWFDGFSDFLPQHYMVIKEFLKHAQSVHVSLCIPEEFSNEGVFFVPLKTCDKLKKTARDIGARIYEQKCDDVCRTVKSPEIIHLMNNWDSKRNTYPSQADNISVFCARDLYYETEYVAKQILKEVKDGARFGEISVMCTDTEQYAHLIEAVFGDYGIPYYSDMDIPMTEHPVIMTVLALFDISEENWSYESVFRYVRAGFTYDENANCFEREEADIIENYVLRHGIRGKSRWLSEWTKSSSGVFDAVIGEKEENEDIEKINSVRKKIVAPFENYYNKISGRRTVRELATALYEFLCDIHLFEGINTEISVLNRMGMRNEAEQMKEVWNFLMETINQSVVVSGDEYCSREKFREMIRVGLSKAVMQIIPSGLDRVSVSAADRNSPGVAKIVFFMGAVNGTLPNDGSSEGIFTDRERSVLAMSGLEISGDKREKQRQSEFKLFRAVTSATEKLYFTYPAADFEGSAKQPSAFLRDLYKMFPKFNKSDNLMGTEDKEIYNEKQAFLYVMNNPHTDNSRLIKEYYSENESFNARLPMAEYAVLYKKVQPQIMRESAMMLYRDRHNYSVSRLSDYSACPFSYFVKHGLKAKEQEVWEIKKFEIGSLLHWAVCEYCHEVESGEEDFEKVKEKWKNLTKEESDKIADKIMSEISVRIPSSGDNGRISYLIGRMKKILLRSVEIVRLSLAEGEYTAVCYEENFALDIEWGGKNVGINGVIDRVDAMQDTENGRIALRIIDYKSGKKDFDIVSIANNTDMQLVVYAIAATELYRKGMLGRVKKGLEPSVTGVLYNKLKNDIIKCTESEPDGIEKLRINDMKLGGIVIADDDEAAEVAIGMDRQLSSGGASSDFLKLAVTSAGDRLNKQKSAYESRTRFDILVNYVKKTVIRIDDEIFAGKIDIKPQTKNVGACKYCKFREICLYDPHLDGEQKMVLGSENAWQYMEDEIKG